MALDPAALSRSNTASEAPGNLSSSAKAPSGAGKDASKSSKTVPPAPRVDLEPYYTEIKAGVGDRWATYKDAISQFVLGYLNQAELTTILEPFIHVDPHRAHIHNQLICGIYANILRDTPETPVASWVSANDKPTNVPKPPSGDAADQRMKYEVMQLPPRMRHRIKAIKDNPSQPLTETLLSSARALDIHHVNGHLTHTAMEPPSNSATGLNRDLDIRRHYQQPLVSETHDIPSSALINERILPICYEEGLSAGLADGESCSDLLSTALETFVKDFITNIVQRTRCNAPVSGPKPDIALPPAIDGHHADAGIVYGAGLDRTALGVMTSGYKRRLRDEERAFQNGDVKRSEAGLLPVEVQSLREPGRGKIAPGDLRLVWEMDNTWLRTLAPWLGERILADEGYRYGEESVVVVEDGDGRRGRSAAAVAIPLVNGKAVGGVNGLAIVNGNVNGNVNGYHADRMDIDDPDDDLGWPGALPSDAEALNSLLDDCLLSGQ